MPNPPPTRNFIPFSEALVEPFPNKTHFWYCRPDLVPGSDVLFVRVKIPPGEGHKFHTHPQMEEILYVLAGSAEQWVEREKRVLRAGDALWLPRGLVHATYNASDEELDFLAVLSPARSPGPGTVDVSEDEPWKSLRR